MRILYFDCFSGIAGDMAIGALLDAGLSMDLLSRGLKKLGLKGYELRKAKVRRGELVGTKFDVIVKGGPLGHSHRSLNEILKLIDKSSLNKKVKDIAKDIFNNIGKAEAKVHGINNKKSLRLHELGDIDSIIDIAGIAIALDELGIDEVYSSPIHFGMGLVNTRAGVLPLPGPATLELLKAVPVRISDIEAELVTPTGAGVLKTLSRSFGPMPQMEVSGIGYGAGTKVIEELPNMLRVIIGEREEV